jgi:hypothetical protein
MRLHDKKPIKINSIKNFFKAVYLIMRLVELVGSHLIGADQKAITTCL